MGGMQWEVGIKSYKVLLIEWMDNVLLYSTRNYTQYPVRNHNGKEYLKKKKKNICREFPGGPVVRRLCFHCQGPGFNPWSGN